MVSWDKAFGTAAKIVSGSVGWYLIGLVVTVLFIMLAGGQVIFTVLTQPTGFRSPTMLLAIIEHIVIVAGIGVAAGCVISSLGVMATSLKYSAELYADEVRTNDMMLLRPVAVSNAVAARNFKVCASCGFKNNVNGAYCESCGDRLGG